MANESDDKDESAAQTTIAVESSGVYETAAQADDTKNAAAPRQRTKLEAAEISLNDCLACSGCVTSAESVLIGMQSLDEVRKVVAENEASASRKHMVASIAPQCLASLSAKYTFETASSSAVPMGSNGHHSLDGSFIPLPVILARISFFLRSRFGFEAVTDTTFARHIALQEHQREFLERRQATQKLPGKPSLPMLASACPGWICYAEKTHGELLPFVSKTKSPQQVAGSMYKHVWKPNGQSEQVTPTDVYHIAVMPCYDKKLEASRPDFYDDILASKDVDCVLTTGELDQLMVEEGFDITQPVPDELSHQLEHLRASSPAGTVTTNGHPVMSHSDISPFPTALEHPGSASGSYMFSLMAAAWIEHISNRQDDGTAEPALDVRVVRTSDFTEYTLRSPYDGSLLFKGAHCYGFRNLQNLVRKVQKQTGVRSKKGSAASSVNGESVGGKAGRGGLRGRGGMAKRGGGMVRRGGAAASANGGAVAINGDGQVAAIEEERGYDYVEVMACPGGCVNGGGQIRPPAGSSSSSSSNGASGGGISMAISSGLVESTEGQIDTPTPSAVPNGKMMDLDPEGYSSGWATPTSDGMDGSGEPPMTQGWQGTSKEWVKQVEKAYWSNNSSSGSSALDKSGLVATLVQSLDRTDVQRNVDAMAERVVQELSGGGDDEKRRQMLRTDYRPVEDEAVSGLAVQW